jgi:hypothetical protein
MSGCGGLSAWIRATGDILQYTKIEKLCQVISVEDSGVNAKQGRMSGMWDQ